jgi:ABC-type transport system involved in cytochrome c biogenesis permease component
MRKRLVLPVIIPALILGVQSNPAIISRFFGLRITVCRVIRHNTGNAA